jgi:very-short-patch-repair endonuclease
VTGNQAVDDDKQMFAKQLRREMTPQEAALWQRLRGRRVGGFKFRRQQLINGFIADFYCAEAAVVLEVDGEIHAEQAEYDAHRDQVFAAREIVTVRFANDRIDHDLNAVLSEIEVVCRQRVG